ncbi:AAA family ATPase [Acidithiobacillus sp. IBUN Pt1247-S3]|uniref:nucleotide-binding protein n=1 Tax=Acidithiobacillus sp. IBUN Pt1247-S3 TaxID=3166642 RepID=UPI0034E592E4
MAKPQCRVLVLNSKGGSGKTTLATNLASLLALRGSVLLADLDPQRSSLGWGKRRPGQLPRIDLIDDPERDFRGYPPSDYVVFDAPAGLKRGRLEDMLGEVEVLLMPIAPSPFDMDASQHYLRRLEEIKRFRKGKVRLGVVANRVKLHSQAERALTQFLHELELPLVATLHDSQIYVRAAMQGMGLADLRATEARKELPQWARILRFVETGGLYGT